MAQNSYITLSCAKEICNWAEIVNGYPVFVNRLKTFFPHFHIDKFYQ